MCLQISKTMSILSLLFILLFFLQTISVNGKRLKLFDEKFGNPFNGSDYNTLELEDSATIGNKAIQVTPDSISQSFTLTNRSGRAMLLKPFKIWEKTKNPNETRVVSFNSSFLMNIYRPYNFTPGEGLTFLIAPDLDIPSNSFGEYLGLTNSSIDGNSSNKFVAIEFDTYKQVFDPDDNHVGLDINGVRSVKYNSLTPYGIILSPMAAVIYKVWVMYDGVNKTIEVYMALQDTNSTPTRPSWPVLRSELDLSKHVNPDSYFGFSASTGNYSQLNCVLAWNLTVEILPGGKDTWMIVLIGVCVPVLVLTMIIGGVWFGYYLRKKRGSSRVSMKEKLNCLPGNPKEYDFKVLKKATNNFDEKNKLGRGSYGAVYYGMLLNENTEIAVKCLLREGLKGQDDFLAELTVINRLRHRHLVRLLGWCYKNGKLLLVYEYMPKGSLDQHLFAGPGKPPLSWNHRYKIVAQVSSALHYLHNEYDHNQCVVHRDLKASNIMLDHDYNGSVGDFGLARVLDHENTSYIELEGVQGTIGYIAHECLHTGKTTQQSDVYAFGAVLLEVVCGLRPATKIDSFNGLVDWVWYLHRDGRVLEAVDSRLGEEYDAEEAKRLLLLGLACSHPSANERPKTQAIVQILSGAMPVPYVPPFKPAFVWPATGPVDADASTTDTTSLPSQFTTEWSQQTKDFNSDWSQQTKDFNSDSTDHYLVQ